MDTNTSTPNDKRKYFSPSKKTHKKFSPLSFAGGMLIVVFAFGLVYLLIPKQTGIVATAKNNTVKEDSSIFQNEHFYRIHHHKHIDEDAEDIILMPKEEGMLEKGTLTDKQRKLIELLPNAPSIYLYDLKVTEYQKLYYFPDAYMFTADNVAAPILINLAMKNFYNQRFDSTINQLKPLLAINKDDPNALFYMGAAYFYKKNYVQALIMLNHVADLPNNVFKQDAYWYKALCFIDLNKTAEAKTLLQHIVDAQGFYT
ncbi:MAG: tol-pal system YbgF family protein, partial [Bacteroidia bacterium]